MEHERVAFREGADPAEVPFPDRELHLRDQAGHLGDPRVEERRGERLPVRVIRLLEGRHERDDHRHLQVDPGQLDRVRILVGQPHLPFAEPAGHGPARGSRAPTGKAGDLLRCEAETRGVGRRRRERRESGGAGAQPDVRREIVHARHSERLRERGAAADDVDYGTDALHVPRVHVPPVDRRGVPLDAAEFHGRPAREGGRAHADRIVEREPKDGVCEAVVLDQTLDRMGHRGRFHVRTSHATRCRR